MGDLDRLRAAAAELARPNARFDYPVRMHVEGALFAEVKRFVRATTQLQLQSLNDDDLTVVKATAQTHEQSLVIAIIECSSEIRQLLVAAGSSDPYVTVEDGDDELEGRVAILARLASRLDAFVSLLETAHRKA